MNWGHKLVAAISLFVGFMAYMVYQCVNTDFQLVEKEYYKSELQYQQVINGYANAGALSSNVKLLQKDDKLVIQLPEEMKSQNISGSLWFYCAYDASLDQKMAFHPNQEGNQEFAIADFKKGAYTVKIEWNDGRQNYYSEQSLNL